MPEIAEVKIIANFVKDLVCGSKLVSVFPDKFFNKRFRNTDKLNSDLPAKIVDVRTHGKFAYIVLDNDCFIGFGCGLTGNFQEKKNKHCHIQFNYESESEQKSFYYEDTLRMGNFYYLDKIGLNKKLGELGFDVLTGKEQNKETIVKQFRRFRSNICKVLLNQKCLAGIGNYMKSEILFSCKIDPYLGVGDLTDNQIYQLYQHSRKLAQIAYEAGQISNGSYVDKKDILNVYKKEYCPSGEKVTHILKDKSPDGRSTFWVKSIQRPISL